LDAKQQIAEYKLALDSLGVYRGFLKDDVVKSLYSLLEYLKTENIDIYEVISKYCDFYYKLMEKSKGNGLKSYISEKIVFSENVFSNACQNSTYEDLSEELTKAAAEDLKNLQLVSTFSSNIVTEFLNSHMVYDRLSSLPSWKEAESSEELPVNELLISTAWERLPKELWSFHNTRGAGLFSMYKGFIWEGDKLEGVVSLDPIRLDQLVNYERQKQIVVNNTKAFLKGFKANNILLYGSRGTGKSSTVKALLNEFFTEGLRVIEIPKQNIATFPKLIRILKNSPQKFILFIDDLAFEDSEETYSALKAILEGGLETKPDNVVIYATSNRRHLVKEKFSDREGLGGSYAEDEIHAADSMEEKLSLADRFGITVTYIHPNQREYLAIVTELVKQRGIEIPEEELQKRALQWAMSYNGRSPRTARQFVDSLEVDKDR